MGTAIGLSLFALVASGVAPLNSWTRPVGFPSVVSEPVEEQVGPATPGLGEAIIPYLTYLILSDNVTGSAMEDPPTWTFGLRSLSTKVIQVPPGPGENPYPHGYTNPPVFDTIWVNANEYAVSVLRYSQKTESDAWTFNNFIDSPFSVYRQRVWPVGITLTFEKFPGGGSGTGGA